MSGVVGSMASAHAPPAAGSPHRCNVAPQQKVASTRPKVESLRGIMCKVTKGDPDIISRKQEFLSLCDPPERSQRWMVKRMVPSVAMSAQEFRSTWSPQFVLGTSATMKNGDQCVSTACSYGGTDRSCREFFTLPGMEFACCDFVDPEIVQKTWRARMLVCTRISASWRAAERQTASSSSLCPRRASAMSSLFEGAGTSSRRRLYTSYCRKALRPGQCLNRGLET